MDTLTINGEPRSLPTPLTVAELLRTLGRDARKVAVEVNLAMVPRGQPGDHPLRPGDKVEIVPLVQGGSGDPAPPADKPLVVGSFTFASRLITGTGKYASYEIMRDALAASACEVTTVAVRR